VVDWPGTKPSPFFMNGFSIMQKTEQIINLKPPQKEGPLKWKKLLTCNYILLYFIAYINSASFFKSEKRWIKTSIITNGTHIERTSLLFFVQTKVVRNRRLVVQTVITIPHSLNQNICKLVYEWVFHTINVVIELNISPKYRGSIDFSNYMNEKSVCSEFLFSSWKYKENFELLLS